MTSRLDALLWGLAIAGAGVIAWLLVDTTEPALAGGAAETARPALERPIERPDVVPDELRPIVATDAPSSPPRVGRDRLAAPLPCSFLIGSVRTAGSGKPVDARVQASNTDKGFDASTGAEGGLFALAGVPQGTLRVTCATNGHEAFAISVEVPAIPDLVRCDIVLQPKYKLRVRALTPDGRPLLDALREAKLWQADPIAVASEAPLPPVLPQANVRMLKLQFGAATWYSNDTAETRKRLTTDVAGELELTKPLPLHVAFCLANAVLETKHLTEPVDEISFVVSLDAITSRMCRVRGRVVDAETGLPIEALVSVLPKGTSSGGLPVDKGGWFSVESMQPGLTTLVVRTASYESIERDLDLVAGQELDVGEIRLAKPPGLTGRVLDAKGQPVEAAVRALFADWPPRGLLWVSPRPTRSNAQGSFRFDALSRIRYVLVAEAAGAVGFALIDLGSVRAPGEVEIRLRPATEVTLVSKKAHGTPWTRIVSEEGHTVWLAGGWSKSPVLLPTGAYTIEVFSGPQPSKQTLVVGAQPQTVEVRVR